MRRSLTTLALLAMLSGCTPDKAEQNDVSESASGTTAGHQQQTAKQDQVTASTTFADLSTEMIEQLWQLFPSWAVREGYYAVADQLAIPDNQQRQRVLEFAGDYQARFAEIDAATLDASARSDLALIQNFLDKLVWEMSEFKSHEWNPANYNVSHAFSLILNTDYAPLDERLRTFSKRLEKVPAYYQAAKESLDKPASPQLVLAIQQNEGAKGIFGGELDKKIAESGLEQAEKEELRQRAEAARDAIEGYITYLQTMHAELENTQDYKDFRIGEELYEQKFATISRSA
nr:DUF885 family protein [Microbulbifer sediminum]